MRLIFCLLICVWVPNHSYANREHQLRTDIQQAFLEGYISAVLDSFLEDDQYIFELKGYDAYITIAAVSKSTIDKDKIVRNISQNRSIQNIYIDFSEQLNTDGSQAASQDMSIPQDIKKPQSPSLEVETARALFPAQPIFQRPVADPRWPRFSVGLQNHFKDKYGKIVYTFSFGENVPIYRNKNDHFLYEIGLLAGLYGAMDMSYKNAATHESTRLLNSDYTVGIGLTIATENFQHLFQYQHLSAHLGDELLVSQPDVLNQRINLSYETIKWLCSMHVDGFRPYVSLSYMVRREPDYIKPFTFEYGLDYHSPSTFFHNMFRPIFGIHMHHWEQQNFRPTITVVGGIQLENPLWESRTIECVCEYANGYSRHGQLFTDHSHYVGFALRLSH